MYDELVEALRRLSDWSIMDFEDNLSYANQITEEAADAIEELSRENESLAKSVNEASEILRKRWIPVTERVPEVFKHVLVNIPGMSPHPTVQEAFHEKNEMWYSNGFRYEADEITHWMPLPEPPKEE